MSLALHSVLCFLICLTFMPACQVSTIVSLRLQMRNARFRGESNIHKNTQPVSAWIGILTQGSMVWVGCLNLALWF